MRNTTVTQNTHLHTLFIVTKDGTKALFHEKNIHKDAFYSMLPVRFPPLHSPAPVRRRKAWLICVGF